MTHVHAIVSWATATAMTAAGEAHCHAIGATPGYTEPALDHRHRLTDPGIAAGVTGADEPAAPTPPCPRCRRPLDPDRWCPDCGDYTAAPDLAADLRSLRSQAHRAPLLRIPAPKPATPKEDQ